MRHLLPLKINLSEKMKVWAGKNVPALFIMGFFTFTTLLPAKVEMEIRKKAYFSARDFKRIPEFFSGQEFEGWKVYCRSDQKSREGFYFVVKLDGPSQKLSTDAHWILEWVSSLDPVAKSIEIPIENSKIFGKEVFIGLTGDDWSDKSAQPLAWCLSLMDGQEKVIVKKQSFLWSK